MRGQSRQLTLWSSGKTEAEKRKILHQTNAGKNARQRAQRKTVTMNQKIIVQMRKELRPNAEIAKHLNLHVGLHDLKVRAAVEVITQPNLQPDNAG